MYTVFCDGTKIYDLYTDLYLIDPVLELELNNPGSFEFTMPADHPYFDLPQKMLSRVWVIRDDEEIFRGRVIEEEVDFYNQKKIYCEGELAFLNDSIQRPGEYHDMTVFGYFNLLIENHNAQVEKDKQFEVGYVLVEDPNDSMYRYTNYNSTLTEIKEDLVDDFGGYIRVRNQDGHRYLDYINIEDYGSKNDQAIRFGVNMLDYTQTMDVTDFATVIIPLGERLEESPIEALNMRLTIESVNDGSDAIESEEAVETFGRIVNTVIWDDVTVASNLLEKGKKYLTDYQWDPLVLEVTPIDLHDSDPDTEAFRLGDRVRVISSPHGLDRYFPISAMTIYLDSPDQNTFTLGTVLAGETITERIRSTEAYIKKVDDEKTPTQKILAQAKEQATALITAATHGYVVMQPNDSPTEILIMDEPDIEKAERVWRWNMGGLGYSSTGYEGTYGTAITMNGAIVADFITTGSLTANVIKTGKIQDVPGNNCWDMDNGTLTISTNQFILDSKGNAKFSGTLSAVSGTFSYIYTGNHSYYSSNEEGFYAGSSGISLGEDFRVDSSGTMKCYSAEIYGMIQCENSYNQAITMSNGNISFYEDRKTNTSIADIHVGGLVNSDNTEIPLVDLRGNNGTAIEISSSLSGNGAFIEVCAADSFIDANGCKIYIFGDTYIYGSLYVERTKSRVIETEHYGKVALYSFETASPMFADSGSGTIGDGGQLSVFIDPDFYETIAPSDYQVLITKTSNGKIDWVDKNDGYFDIYGEEGVTFDWMVIAHQRDETLTRLEPFSGSEIGKESA